MIQSADIWLIRKKFIIKTHDVFYGAFEDLVSVACCVFTLMAISHVCSKWVVEICKDRFHIYDIYKEDIKLQLRSAE